MDDYTGGVSETMAKKAAEKRSGNDFSVSRPTMSDLRGRQSVRATFRLSAGCINAISVVATHLGIKQKTLFDHLAEDTRSLDNLARNLRDLKLSPENRIQKTYVISRRTLASLEEAARSHNAPRDALVEVSVRRLLPLIARERQKHRKRKALLEDIRSHFRQGQRLLKKVEAELGVEDPLSVRLAGVINTYASACSFMEGYIEKGNAIEAFDPRQMEIQPEPGDTA